MGATVIFFLYCGLITSVPALLFFQDVASGGIASFCAALLLVLAAATSLSRDQYRLRSLVSPALLAGCAGVFLLMLFQIAPMPGGPLMNPIWSSAAAAFGEKPEGSVTIDTGMTLMAICRLTCMVAVALLAAMLGQDRQRAERLLSALVVICTLVSLERTISAFQLPEVFQLLPANAQSAAETIGILGFVLATAVVVRGYEHALRTRSKLRTPGPFVNGEAATALVACLVNLGAVACSSDPTMVVAALFGAGLIVSVLIIRKRHFSSWGQAGVAAVMALVLVTFIVLMPGRAENDVIARMIDDARPLGVGAGTLAALMPIYGNASVATAPDISAVATIAIEMGRPFLWLITLIAAAWAAMLLRHALKRGRDYVYPAAGAGCIAAMLISALSNGGGLALPSTVVFSAVLGLAIAQSKGETATGPAFAVPDTGPPLAHDPRAFRSYLRGALAVFGFILAAQATWVLLPEALRPAPIGFPVDQRHATVARQDQEKAGRSAAIAGMRGDLWAESAFSEAVVAWTDPAEIEASATRNAMTASSLLKTLHYAPHRGDAWLMLASICERLKPRPCNKSALLKMSYYTAPDQVGLLPLRLGQVLRTKDISGDDELADMARRDIRSVLTRFVDLRPALIAAYRTASPAGRRLVEQTVIPIDPGYLTMLRAQLT